MKAKSKIKQIFASILLVVAIFASCSFQTLYMGGMAISSALAKSYESTEKVTTYTFDTGKWGTPKENYDDPTDPSDSTKKLNAFKGSTDKLDLTSLKVEDNNTANLNSLISKKPTVTIDGHSTTVESAEKVADADYGVMYISADNAESKQLKGKTNEKGDPVYSTTEFVMDETDPANPVIKFYDKEADKISEKDIESNKYVPASEADITKYGQEVAGKYKQAKQEQELVDIYYFYKSNSTSLSKDGYYVISFYAYTVNAGTEFSVRVAHSDTDIYNASLENQSSEGKWTKFYMFFHTRADVSGPSVNIYIYLGNSESILGSNKKDNDTVEKLSGAVYIDNLSFRTINQTDYNNQTIDGKTPSAIIDEENKKIVENKNLTEGTITINKTSGTHYYYSSAKFYNENGEMIENPNFENTINIHDKFTGETGYNSEAAWQYYIPEYFVDQSGSSSDSVKSEKLSPTTIEKYKEAYRGINEIDPYVTISQVVESTEIQLFDLNSNGEYKYADSDTEKESPLKKDGYSTFNTNNQIIKIENNSRLYSLGLVTAPFEILQYRFYKISVWVKATDEDSSARVVVFGKVPTGDKEEGQIILTSQRVANSDIYKEQAVNKDGTADWKDDSAVDYNNGWYKVDMFIHGNAYANMDIQLALLADKNSTIYFDNITVESVLSTEIPSTASKKLILTHTPTYSSSNKEQLIETSVTNGYFNNILTTDVNYDDYFAPYTPASWDVTHDDYNSEDVIAGIVPTNSTYNDATIVNADGKTIQKILGGAVNPNIAPCNDYFNGLPITPAQNNVFAIYAPKSVTDEDGTVRDNLTHDYKLTNDIQISSSNTVYKLTFKVLFSGTESSYFNGKVFAKLVCSDNTIADMSYTIDNTIAHNEWIQVTMLIRTGSSGRKSTLTLGVEDATGTVFFKNVGFYKYNEVERKDENGETIKVSANEQFEEEFKRYNELSANEKLTYTVIDFQSYNFTMHGNDPVKIEIKDDKGEVTSTVVKDYFESFSHKVEENPYSSTDTKYKENKDNGTVGVANTNDSLELKAGELVINAADLVNPKAKSDKVLVIYNDGERYTTVSPKNTFTLASSSFYTVEVYVKTSGFTSNSGLTIKMGAISATFDKVNTTSNNNSETNGYELYRAIIRTGKSDISGFSVNFILGTMSNKLSGYALVSDINITKLADKEAFDEIVEAVNKDDKKTIVKNFYVEENKDTDETTPAENSTLVTFFLVFSSILLVVALAIALVAIIVKKHPRKPTVKVSEKDNKYKGKKSEEEKEDPDRGGFV